MLFCLAGATVVWFAGRPRRWVGWISFGVVALTSAAIWTAAAQVLLHGPGPAATFLSFPQWGFALRLYVDGLSAVFLALIGAVAFVAALYSPAYLRSPAYAPYSLGRYYANFLLFVAAMYGLVSTTDMLWFFFIFWQLMTLPGYTLIRFEAANPAHARAANRYLWMMQLACALTMLGAALLIEAPATGTTGEELVRGDFDAVSHHLPTLLQTDGVRVALAFALFLAGFGIKLGMWPFGAIWLPDAHPAAPSPVSAMLSGVMIKTGVYGLLRYFLWLVPEEAREFFPAAEWGLALAVLGTVTLFLGTLRALFQEQTKRLLAWSSIGQVGYILLAIGACLALLGLPGNRGLGLASLALLAAIFHTVNHGLFKSLLFLTAGSLWYRTGTQDLNRMGGAMRYMPWTGVAALLASLSIAGVPLTNGFASKWCLVAATLPTAGWIHWLPACAALAVLTSALTLAVFVQYFGAAFLSRPHAGAAPVTAREVPASMLLAQLLPAGLCMLLGLLPGVAFLGIQAALDHSRQGLALLLADALRFEGGWWTGITLSGGHTTLTPLFMVSLMLFLFALAVALASWGGSRRRVAQPWLCGYAQRQEGSAYAARHYFGAFKSWLRVLGPKAAALPTPKVSPSKTAVPDGVLQPQSPADV